VYRDGKYTSPKCVIVNGRRDRQQDITPGPSDYAPYRSDVMSRHRRQPAYVMTRADSAKRRQSQMTVTPGSSVIHCMPRLSFNYTNKYFTAKFGPYLHVKQKKRITYIKTFGKCLCCV